MVGPPARGSALLARRRSAPVQITVLAEEADAAYDRVGLTSYTESWDRSLLALPGNYYTGDSRVRLILNARVAEIDRAGKSVLTTDGRQYCLRPVGAGHRLLRCSSHRYPATTCPAATSTARSTTWTAIRADVQRTLAAGHTDAGVVIGGGLLGLEAANALRTFGLRTHVVEMMPRLMAQQLDEAGGALLGRMIGELGIALHVGVGTDSIEPSNTDDGSESVRVHLSDGEGDRRRAGRLRGRHPSPRRAGPCRRSGDGRAWRRTDRPILRSTADPNIYAVGEVAAIEGRCYGLVGPGYTSAEVVADQLLGGERGIPRG